MSHIVSLIQLLLVDHKIQMEDCIFLLGHVFELHLADCDDTPEQVFPPCCGDGALQVLYLHLVPPAQVRLQLP